MMAGDKVSDIFSWTLLNRGVFVIHMANPIQTLPVALLSNRGHSSSGSVELKIWDKKEKLVRASKALGIAWGLAIASVLIPILHFILVPLFILSGPIVFFWVASQEQVILGGKGECPECHREFEIVRSPVKWPMSDLCNHCQAEIKIERAQA
jgi:hypothetical protein